MYNISPFLFYNMYVQYIYMCFVIVYEIVIRRFTQETLFLGNSPEKLQDCGVPALAQTTTVTTPPSDLAFHFKAPKDHRVLFPERCPTWSYTVSERPDLVAWEMIWSMFARSSSYMIRP